MKIQFLLRIVLVGLMSLSTSVYAGGVVTLNFDTDGVLPHDEAAAAYPGSAVDRYGDGRVQDAVAGGLWTQLPDAENDGYLGYYGDVPELASTDTTGPMSINANLRLLQSVPKGGEFYFNIRGAAGFLWLYFEYDSATGASAIGGRHSGGSIFTRPFPAGKTLGEFHTVTVTWDPTLIDSMPAKLYVDGDYIGDTYAGIKSGWSNTSGYIEFGDFLNGSQNSMFEVDWVRFGNDQTVVMPAVAETPTFDPVGDTGGFTTPLSVTITSATGGATIRYTTDGTEPDENSDEYTSAVTVTPPALLKARAWASGHVVSEVASSYYGLSVTNVATPTFSPDGGLHAGSQLITISCATTGSTIYYTTDGTVPTTGSAAYTEPIWVTPPVTLMAKAWAAGDAPSDVKSAFYGQSGAFVVRFDTDGQRPDAEHTSLTRVSYRGMDDDVADGLWKGNPDDMADTGGYLYYKGNVPELANTDSALPMSINVRTRLLKSCLAPGEYYYNMRGPFGSIWLAFYYDAENPDESKIGSRHDNGSYMWRYLPWGMNLGEFHNYAITWHPADGGSSPSELWVDGVSVGGGYIAAGVTNTDGYVEFGDGATSPGSTIWETHWVRFAMDENVLVYPDPNDDPLETVDASTFGFSPVNATSALQAAIDTGAETVIVPNMGSDWIVDPICLTMSNQEIVLEEGVNITARRGYPAFDSGKLISNRRGNDVYSIFNVKITGEGNNVLKMWQDDYTQSPYIVSESRAGIALYSPYNVTISGITVQDTGGDGLYLSLDPFRPGTKTYNVIVKDAVFDNAYRNGISVISANRLLIDNCIVKNTSGTSPQCGIDFEPNGEYNYLTNCVVRNTILHDNYNQGIMLMLDHLSTTGQDDATIAIENCTVVDNGGGAGIYTTLGLPGLTVTDCLLVENGVYGVWQKAGTSPPSLDVTYSAFWNNSTAPVGGPATLGTGSLTGVEPVFTSTDSADVYYMYLDPSCPTSISEGASDGSYMGARPVGPACGDPWHPYPDGDFDGDCYVSLNDLALLADNWLDGCSEPTACEGADADDSGNIDLLDFAELSNNWETCTNPNPPCSYVP